MRVRLLIPLLLGLVLAACGRAVPHPLLGDDPAPPPSADGTPAAGRTPEATRTDGTPGESDASNDSNDSNDSDGATSKTPMAQTERCADQAVDYEIGYPAGWQTNDGEVLPACRLFDPDATEVEPGTEVPLDIAVSLRTSQQPLTAFVGSDGDARMRTSDPIEVDGHDGFILQKRGTGHALLPEDLRFTQVVVDLGDRRLVASTFDVGDDYERNRTVLQQMIDSLEIGTGHDDSTADQETSDPVASDPDPVALPDTREVCELAPSSEEHLQFAHPAGWQVTDDDCRFFDPELDEVADDTEPAVAMSVRVEPVAFADAAASGPGTRDEITYVGSVAGRPLVRVRAEATGETQHPEGTPSVTYLVDLTDDDEPRTLVATAQASRAASFELAALALDSTVRTLVITPPTHEADSIVVARRTAGPEPFTVTYDHECFRLRREGPGGPAVDEACDVALGDAALAATVLEDDDLRVAAGLATPLAAFVTSDAASAPYGAVTTALEGASAFAYEVVGASTELRAVDLHRDVLGTTSA